MADIVLLCLIQAILIYKQVLSQTNVCIWGRVGVNSPINGLYIYEGTYNNKPYYHQPAGASCVRFYIYYKSFDWKIHKQLGSSAYNAYCDSSSTLSNCNQWEVYDGSRTSIDSKVTISFGPTITSMSLQHYESITVPYNTSTPSQYFNYTIYDLIGATFEQVNVYYMISGSSCHIPKLTLWSWDNDDRCPTIIVNDIVLNTYGCVSMSDTNTKYVKCVSDYDLSQWIKTYSISSLHIQIDPMNTALETKSQIQLSCWIPSIISPMNEMWLEIDQTLPTNQYVHFTLGDIATQKSNINGNDYAINEFFYFIKSEPCYNPLLTVYVLDSDYEANDEYLQIDVNGNTISNCYPQSNTCSKYYNCLNSYDLGITSITDFIHIRMYGIGVDIPCKINDNIFGFVVTNVTLSCYIQPKSTQFPSNTPTDNVIHNPTKTQTLFPTLNPTFNTNSPTISPTIISNNPTNIPTKIPSIFPTISSNIPTHSPTNNPTKLPTSFTKNPSFLPTINPTISPTFVSLIPTISPTNPTNIPTNNPSIQPSIFPTKIPTNIPTISPTKYPSDSTSSPTKNPSKMPILNPSKSPIINPSIITTQNPIKIPTIVTTEISEYSDHALPQQNEATLSFNTILIIVITVSAFVILLIFIYVLYRTLKRKILINISESSKQQYNKVQGKSIDFGDVITTIGSFEPGQQEGKNIEMISLHNDMHNNKNKNNEDKLWNNNLTIPVKTDDGSDINNLLERQKQIKIWFKNHVKLNESNDKYYNLFVLNGYDELSLIAEITNVELIEMGVDKLAHRKRIVKALDAIAIDTVHHISD